MTQPKRRTKGSGADMMERRDDAGRRSDSACASAHPGARLARAAAVLAFAFLACLPTLAPIASFAEGGAPVQDAPEKPKRTVEAADVYYGDPASEWSKPAEVDADAAFAEIEEFKRIRDEKIEPGDAKYDLLLSKATRRFKAAVRAAAKDGGYDLVAKVGAVKGCDSVPAITQTVISKL